MPLAYSMISFNLLISQSTIDLLDLIITGSLTVIGMVLLYNYRRQVKQKSADGRIEAYKRLFEITKIAMPMRLEKYHPLEIPQGPLSDAEMVGLYHSLTDWYFDNGNGIFLGNKTRKMYLTIKKNLVCPYSKFIPSHALNEKDI